MDNACNYTLHTVLIPSGYLDKYNRLEKSGHSTSALEIKDDQSAVRDRLKEELGGLLQHLQGLQIITVGNKNSSQLFDSLLDSHGLSFYTVPFLVTYKPLYDIQHWITSGTRKKSNNLILENWTFPTFLYVNLVAFVSYLIPKYTYSYLGLKQIFTNSWLRVHSKMQCSSKATICHWYASCQIQVNTFCRRGLPSLFLVCSDHSWMKGFSCMKEHLTQTKPICYCSLPVMTAG